MAQLDKTNPGSGTMDEVQHLQKEIGTLKSDIGAEFERLHTELSLLQTSLQGEVYHSPEEKAQAYWRRNISLIGWLLVIWALVSYVAGILMATAPMGNIGSVPFSFWFAQQGAILVFMLLIWIYARKMDALDREFDLNE
jgi:putative solute:sodium symporter small subunit